MGKPKVPQLWINGRNVRPGIVSENGPGKACWNCGRELQGLAAGSGSWIIQTCAGRRCRAVSLVVYGPRPFVTIWPLSSEERDRFIYADTDAPSVLRAIGAIAPVPTNTLEHQQPTD